MPWRHTSQLKNRQRTWIDTSPRRTYRGPTEIWKNAEHLLSSERCKLKPQWDITSHLSEWPSLINHKQQVLARMWRKGNIIVCALLGMQTGAATVENSMEFPQKIKNGTAFWSSDSIAGNPEIPLQKNLCTAMFIEVLFTIANCWKHSKCPSVNEWIKKLWYINTMEYYTVERKKELLLSWQHGWNWRALCWVR